MTAGQGPAEADVENDGLTEVFLDHASGMLAHHLPGALQGQAPVITNAREGAQRPCAGYSNHHPSSSTKNRRG